MAALPVGWKQYRAWQQRRFEQACTAIRAAGGEIIARDPIEEAQTPESVGGVLFYDEDGSLPPLDGAAFDRLRPYLRRFPPFYLKIISRKCAGDSLSHFNGLRNINALNATGLSDQSLRGLADLPKLEAVGLSGREFTDRGLLLLRNLPALRNVAAVQTRVTRHGAVEFEASNPGVMVFLPYRPVAPTYEVHADDEGGSVVRLDSSGKPLWSVHLPHLTFGDPVWNQKVVVCSEEDGAAALDAATGRVLWHSRGDNYNFTINGDIVVSAAPEQPAHGSYPARPPSIMGRRLTDGQPLFTLTLPPGGIWNSYYCSPLGDGFLCSRPLNDTTYLIDGAGRIRLRLDKNASVGMCYASGWILLKSDGFERLGADGRQIWSAPLDHMTGMAGEILQLPSGEIIGLAYDPRFEGYELLRINAQTGVVAWRCPVRWALAHSAYSLEAHAQLRGALLAVTSLDLEITVRVFDAKTGRLLLCQSADRSSNEDLQPQ